MENKGSTDDKKGKSPEGTDGGAKRKRKTSTTAAVEPRTPLKRQRVPVQKFQSPAEDLIPTPSTSKQKDATELLHKKASFLGVRGDEGTFYLCKTLQNVFSNTRKFRIQWLDLSEPPDVYKLDFLDSTDADCILTNVRMERVARDTYRLPLKEQKRIEEILHKALKKERGEPVDDIVIDLGRDDDDSEEDGEEDEEWEDEPTPKKSKMQAKSRKTIAVSVKGKSSKSKEKKSSKDKKSSKKDKKDSGKKKKEEKKKGPDRNLKPNPKLKILEKDPFFETRDKLDFISKTVQGKLAIRAILLKDAKLLKSQIEDRECCYKLDNFRSVDVQKNALHYALETNDHDAIRTLVKDYFCKNERLEKGCPQSVLIGKSDRGRYNPMSLGIRSVREISQSRGNKQGNDAFVMDIDQCNHCHEDYVEDALKLGVSKETLEVLMTANPDTPRDHMVDRAITNLYQAVLCGNRKLAGNLIEESMKDPNSTGFSYLHKDVLLMDKEDLRDNILAASVKKKPWDNRSITPLHCSAINPNVNYLKRLLSVEPNINLEDRDHRRPVHFAAVCDGVGPLEFLLQRGASPLEVDNQGRTPLHYACSAGRPRNVDILLKKAKEAAAKQGDMFQTKWGLGGVDKPSRSSYCPIHIAISYNHADVLKILIKHQVDVNKILSAGKNKLSPLMIAASHGSLEIARILIQNGAHVEQLDKLKRSALTHAVMNGNTHVASYLLYLGADPDRVDSSGNSVVHYAAAYGWPFTLKLLLDAGADPTKSNEWKTTPVGIAFLKGHVGIVDYLLKQPGVDINFRNDEGLTLASVATSSSLEPGLYDQIQYLLEKKIDLAITDVNGLDALHHLAMNKITKTPVGWMQTNKEIDENKMDLSVKIATVLLDAGCDPTCRTSDGRTALMFAIERLNVKLVRLLVDRGATVTSNKSDQGKTILHLMADLCMESDLSPLLKILVEEHKENKIATQQKTKAPSGGEKIIVENGESSVESVQKVKETDKKSAADEKGDSDVKQEERMEVDEGEKKTNTAGDGDGKTKEKPKENGEINGMEVDEAPPTLEKVSKDDPDMASQDDIWPLMSAEVDQEGYTPLLWACKVYRDYKKNNSTSKEELKRYSEYGRNFIKALIELTAADVSETVKEKAFTGDTPTEEKLRYTKDGKSSAVHMLLRVGHEIQLESTCQCLELLLSFNPNLEHKNMEGKTALVLSVESSTEKAVELLIAAKADVNVVFGNDVSGMITPLHLVTRNGKVKLVKMLIGAGANVNNVNTKTQDAPLHIAAGCRDNESNAIEMTRMILEAGADVNTGKTSALHSAVLANLGTSNASTELEEFLLAKGANVFAKDEKGRIPLHYAFITRASPESVTALDPIELCSILTESMGDKDLDARDEMGRTPLHLAAMRGATICCVHLLQRKVSLSGADKLGYTPLCLAVENLHDSCAIMMIQRGANVENSFIVPAAVKKDWRQYHEDGKGKKKPVWVWSPAQPKESHKKQEVFDIYKMAISGELQGVAHMVLDSTGLTGKAVEAALRVNKYHIALRHLHRIKDDSIIRNYKNSEGQNLLHVLALYTKPGTEEMLQLKVARILVDKGVSLMQQDNYKRYPVVYTALQHQSVQLATLYLDTKSPGLNLNSEDMFGRTIMVAYFWDQKKIYRIGQTKQLDFLKLLLAKGASLDIKYKTCDTETPLFDVTIASPLQDFFIPGENTRTVTPLISALYNCDFGLVKFLLQNGASPNLADQDGVTPLMHAVKINDKEMIKLLLNNDYNMSDSNSDAAAGSRHGLRRSLSRRVFAIKPMNDPETDDEDEENKSEGSDDEEEENEEEMEEAEEENPECDAEDGSDAEGSENWNEDDNEEDAADSDHDTDVVEDEEESEEDHHLPIPRLGSKQLSVKRTLTTLGSATQDEFPTVEKTSSIDVNAKDSRGWTAIHHLVSPLHCGTYDNEEILCILQKAGASLDIESKDGVRPLKLAVGNGAAGLVYRLQTLMATEEDKKESLNLAPFCAGAESDSCLSTATGSSFQDDAEAMLNQLKALLPSKTSKYQPEVDKNCMAAKSGEVMFDHGVGMPYDVTLSKIEVHNLLSDTYNFYKMQVIWHKAKDVYILFTKWGRIGDTGNFQNTPFHKLEDAVKEFVKNFRAKTGNLWTNVKKFENVTKKYRLVQKDNEPKLVVKINFDLQSNVSSKLPTEVQDLLQEMADVGMMEAAMKKAKMAEDFMPFGRIKRESVIDGRKLLLKIGDIVSEIEKKKRGLTYDAAEHQAKCEEIAKLSTEYYSLVPLEGYSYDRITPLNNNHLIKSHLRLLSNLLDLEVASKVLLGAQYRITECNPLDYIYQAIGCSIQPLREDDVESQYILKYIKSSSGRPSNVPKVLCVYKLVRPGEEKRTKFSGLANHRLLWHGSSVSNFISILRNGLLVAPPEAPMTGHAFGEGIYSADTFAKSKMYCHNYNPKSAIKLALLCEVALGNCKEDIDSNLEVDLINSEYNSLKIHGQSIPDRDWDLTMPYGAVMPVGTVKTNEWKLQDKEPWVPYSEYIVQDSDQIRLRYLVQFV